jgi:hypothetical protein
MDKKIEIKKSLYDDNIFIFEDKKTQYFCKLISTSSTSSTSSTYDDFHDDMNSKFSLKF